MQLYDLSTLSDRAPRALPDLTPRRPRFMQVDPRHVCRKNRQFLGEATIKIYAGNILMKLGRRTSGSAAMTMSNPSPLIEPKWTLWQGRALGGSDHAQ
jgi:hypothetical protein